MFTLPGLISTLPTLTNPLPRTVTFQYNPETITRNVTASHVTGGPSTQVTGFSGAPKESISLDVQVESIDSGPVLGALGVRPQISLLQLLAYPSLIDVGKDLLLARAGAIQVNPMSAPTTVFVFGPTEIVPVTVTSVNVVEEFFDAMLRCVRAKLSLSMDVVRDYDVSLIAYQTQLEAYGVLGMAGEAASAVSAGASLAGGVAKMAASGAGAAGSALASAL